MAQERRRAKRYPIAVRIDLPSGGGTTQDISGLGVRFATDLPMEIEDEIDFTLSMPGSCDIRCRGRIVRVDSENGKFIVGATIDRYLLPEEAAGTLEFSCHPILYELRAHNPEGWEWGE